MPIHPFTQIVVYTGVCLGGETAILRVFPTYGKALDWIRKVLRRKGVHSSHVKNDQVLRETIANDVEISVICWGDLLTDAHELGAWESDSLWAMINHDFSHMTAKRARLLLEDIRFVGYLWDSLEGDLEEEEGNEEEDEDAIIAQLEHSLLEKPSEVKIKKQNKDLYLYGVDYFARKHVILIDFACKGSVSCGLLPGGEVVRLLGPVGYLDKKYFEGF